MPRAITIAEVARLAGVSKTTVSRVLNGVGAVDPVTAARVNRIIAESGYVPSARAVGLARGRTRVIGVLVPPLTWPWTAQVLHGVLDAVDDEGYSPLLFTSTRAVESVCRFGSRFSGRSIDGLLALEPQHLGFLSDLQRGGLPVALLHDRGDQAIFPTVGTDNRDAAHAAARHLLRLGRTRPVVVTGPMDLECSRQRLAGFADVYAVAGHPLEPWRVIESDFTVAGGRRHISLLLKSLRYAAADHGIDVGFDALFAHNDLSAAGAMQALRCAGLRVPQDVAVVGFDDVPDAVYTDPPLTTVHQPLSEMGEAAARLLMALADGVSPAGIPVTLPTNLVVRGSSTTQVRW